MKIILTVIMSLLLLPFTQAAAAEKICPTLRQTLTRGSNSAEVLLLKKFLIQEGYTITSPTNKYFDASTEAAVKKFQIRQKIVSSGTPATTGFGAVGRKTRNAISGCASIQGEIPIEVGASGVTPPQTIGTLFTVKKVPADLVVVAGSAEKKLEITYTTQQLQQDPKKLQVCWTLLDSNNVKQTETDCWPLGEYGTKTFFTNGDFSLAPAKNNTIYKLGNNTVILLFELIDPASYRFNPATRKMDIIPLASDTTGPFILNFPSL